MHLKGTRVAAYARYSSDKQNVSSVDDQLRRFRTALAPIGSELSPALTFTDHAISGKSTDRPGFEALMERVKRRELDVLLVEDVSRLARNQSDATRLYEELAFYGVQLISLGDGIDTQQKGAKLQFGVKALFADIYLDDLRDKTLRGMEGRAHAGLATGGRLLGYRSVALTDAYGKPAGFKVEIDPAAAETVRRIFLGYLSGLSFNGIAIGLNTDQVPSPRDKTQHKRKVGWSHSTIRAILYNERYVGVWSFNVRRWVKIPGTNRRRPERKDASEVVRTVRDDLRIIDRDTWDAVQDRLRSTKARFTKDADGKPKGRAHGAVSYHPFSGLLECAACDGPMVIGGGEPGRRYYACSNSRRGRCKNRKTVLASVVRTKLLAGFHDRVSSRDGIAFARKRIAEHLGEMARNREAEIREKRARLARTDHRIANLVDVLASGERSDAITHALRDLEAHKATEHREIAALNETAVQPVRLPSPGEVMDRLLELDARMDDDPIAAREELRRYLDGGKIRLEIDEAGNYVARWALLPLVLLADTYKNAPGVTGGVSERSQATFVVAGAGFEPTTFGL
jgi:site-specific DNA recombinase